MRELLRKNPDGTIATFANLGAGGWNEIVVDGRGNTYVNGPRLLLITPDGKVSAQTEDFAFPDGMAVTPDNRTLICAESHARRLTAFGIASDGGLSGRRIWAISKARPTGFASMKPARSGMRMCQTPIAAECGKAAKSPGFVPAAARANCG